MVAKELDRYIVELTVLGDIQHAMAVLRISDIYFIEMAKRIMEGEILALALLPKAQ